ncbi:hypothetical protein AMTRI_Chr09g37110 [Amborella trichopoda]|uniref:Protein kinase domain-containing protein n=1 Tax=Amborella trichopoda TaxID=13333 RepID=W1NVT1_AMBTC|nr:probably inactive receptor-like protein kinase At2g46850 [Amborella trichopoda]ERM99370.1 hypothetical protein AMTR_s00235p00019150 [Amborella trichopoda]|eukprot:XP_006836517.1 probably inactive receptor-like protein kinase At2g46850 [Amborella trichopoda]
MAHSLSSVTTHLLLWVSLTWVLLLSSYLCNSLPGIVNKCNEKCGPISITYPFYLKESCGFHGFRLGCSNSTPTLELNSETFTVLEISSDSISIDFPGSSCRFDSRDFEFKGNQFYGISIQNVIQLWDCEKNSSLCKLDCRGPDEENENVGCEGNSSCCYPLSDTSFWQPGDGFSVFDGFGCQGLSISSVSPGSKPELKLEWAVPGYSPGSVCSNNALSVNATTVAEGIRCVCEDGFLGDGFAEGIGCVKACRKNGRETYGEACHNRRNIKQRAVILAGILAFTAILAAVLTLYCQFRQSNKDDKQNPNPTDSSKIIAFRKLYRAQLFTYKELEVATKGFEESQRILLDDHGAVYAGELDDGSYVSIHKILHGSDQGLGRVLEKIDALSRISHKNIARLLGCCTDLGSPLVVFELPRNGTLKEHLQQEKGRGLDWLTRINILTKVASALAYLKFEISPPIYHQNLQSGNILLDYDYTAKIAGFGLELLGLASGSHLSLDKTDEFSIGGVMLEIITGLGPTGLAAMALVKIRDGRLYEMVDPFLLFQDPSFQREAMERVAGLAVRCLSVQEVDRPSMMEVAEELQKARTESMKARRESRLEETFSNSSLLQMVSMSPDSIYVPCVGSENGASAG